MAQNIHVGVPFNSIGNSYFESVGINWSLGIPGRGGGGTRVMGISPSGQLIPNPTFSFNGGNLMPPFGVNPPVGGGRLDLRGNNFRLGLSMAKGSSTWLSSQSPSLVVQNGFGGSLFSGQVRPFVTGYVPTVGGSPMVYPDNAVTRAINSGMLETNPSVEHHDARSQRGFESSITRASTATTGDQSVAAIKAERARMLEARRLRMEALIAEAKELQQQEQNSKSRRKYLEAIGFADDEYQKSQLREIADSLKTIRR